MDCRMHQVLVAMLAVTPAADASAPVKASGAQVVLGKKSKAGAQLAQVTLPRPVAAN